MVRTRETTLSERTSIEVLRNEGFTYKYVSEPLKIPLTTCKDVFCRKFKTSSHLSRPRVGRPKALSERDALPKHECGIVCRKSVDTSKYLEEGKRALFLDFLCMHFHMHTLHFNNILI